MEPFDELANDMDGWRDRRAGLNANAAAAHARIDAATKRAYRTALDAEDELAEPDMLPTTDPRLRQACEALMDLIEACRDAYNLGRIPSEPFVRARNVLAEITKP